MVSGLSWTVDYLSHGVWIVDGLGQWIIVFWSLDNGLSWAVDYLSFDLWIVD